MKTLVTGADGFIGSHMVDFLREKGHDVIAIGDDYDLRIYTQRIFEDVDWVFHFAANMGGVGFFSKYNYYPFFDNMTIDLNILKACEEAGVKRIFYPASACAYPINMQISTWTPALSESMLIPADADQMYGWEKLMIILLAKQSPLDIRVGILNTVFGERQEWQGERTKFPPAITYKVFESKRTGKPMQIWGDGTQTRTFLYIKDAIEKIYEIMATPGYWGEVNVASDTVVTVRQCADWLCEIAGIEPNYEFQTDKPTGVLARGIDNSKFNKHYKYRDKFSPKEGFKRLYRWIEEQHE